MVSSERPWKAWSNTTTAGRPVAARAYLTAFSTRLAAGVEQRGALLVVAGGEPVQRLGDLDVGLVGRGEEAGVGVLRELGGRRGRRPRGAALPTVVTAMPLPRSMNELPSTSTTHAAAGGGGVDAGAAGQSGRERGLAAVGQFDANGVPVISVTIRRTCSSSGPPTSAFVIPTAYGCDGNRRMSNLDNRTLRGVRSGQFGLVARSRRGVATLRAKRGSVSRRLRGDRQRNTWG